MQTWIDSSTIRGNLLAAHSIHDLFSTRVACVASLSLLVTLLFAVAPVAIACQDADEESNTLAINAKGEFPVGEDGEPLNLGFEKGSLQDWTAEGEAFERQPVEGGIDPARPFGADKNSEHVGEHWLGGYEFLGDTPKGTLQSAPFQVTKPWASFLIGGGRHYETRIELVRADTNQVFLRASGIDIENLRPVVVDLRNLMGESIFIRVVDDHSGGWGHVNFDDFRIYDVRPRFRIDPLPPRQDAQVVEVYPHAGLDAESAAKAMQLPPGFSVQVGAAEPDINQPIAMALDDRGRVWVAEAYEYPSRAPEGEGTDRILIFEDTDADGTLDSRKVFAENLNLVSGFEIGFGGVFVGAAPYLLFIPDRNGDDIPDGEPEILLDGWGYHDTHETLNAFIWGPDGWLYGCHGVFTHSKVGKPGTPDEQRTPINAGIWRYHPVRHEFEVFAYGTSNPWGIDFNDQGQAFATACVIPHLFHIIQGARYQRQAGSHFNPHVYDDIKTIALHRHFVGNQWNDNDRKKSDELGGGHAHAGAMIYLGGSWPDEYRNQLFMNNIHGNRFNVDQLIKSGSGYIGDRAPDFLLTGDKWSQMINMRYGPDGQVWVIDWYDANQCHHRDEDAHDRTNGRLYRIVYNDTPPVRVDLATASDEALIEYLGHENDWYSRHAKRILQERTASGQLRRGSRATLYARVTAEAAVENRLRALWALHVCGGVPQELSMKLLNDDEPMIRAWTIQLLLDDKSRTPESNVIERLATLASEDDSPTVRLYLASVAQRLSVSSRWSILDNLVTHADDATDHNLPLMYWYASESFAESDPQRAMAFAISAGANIPLIRDFMIRRLGSDTDANTLTLLLGGLADATDDETRLTFLRGIQEALGTTPDSGAPESWTSIATNLAGVENPEVRLRANAISLAYGEASARGQVLEMISDSDQPLEIRRLAIRFLATSRQPAVGDLASELIRDPGMRSDVLNYLTPLVGDDAAALVAATYRELSLPQKRIALAALTSNLESANAMLDLVEDRTIPRSDLSANLIRQVRNLGDTDLDDRLSKVWGVVRDSDASVTERIAQFKGLLTSEQGAHVDVELGRAIFAKTCQQCHTLFESGGKVGPDLTGSNRKDLDYLLSNVLDPSAVMAKEYQTTVVVTSDGRTYSGIAKPATGGRFELINETQTLLIEEDDIEDIATTNKSMMPEDLLTGLNETEVRSLVKYLAADGQSPMLARTENVNGFFNQTNLEGWVGDSTLWSVDDGEIVGKSDGLDHNQFLVNELAFDNFRFACDVKLVGDVGNSGIQFRSQPMSNGEVRGYQADIGPDWWGKLYEELGRGLLVSEGGESLIKKGDWNRYEIIAVGDRVQTFLNGEPCVDLVDPQGSRRGIIAFQLHSGPAMEVRFRNFSVELLEAPNSLVDFRSSLPNVDEKSIAFEKRQLDTKFRSEGATIGDFNNDGHLDIAAGNMWYEAPDWTPHPIRAEPQEFAPKGYSDSFCNFAQDVNGDGLTDLLVVDFPGNPTWWFENPGEDGKEWARHELTPVTNNESPTFLDVTNNGRREMVFGGKDGIMQLASPQSHAEAPWKLMSVSNPGSPGTDRFSHGLGVGDVNLDGRRDVLVTNGWWEQPAEETGQPWAFHNAPWGAACAQMFAFDCDGDGDQDVISSSAHNYGIWWHEQTESGWQTHEIDKSFSQTHALCLADINGDGNPDLVTGKRFWAHNGNDPGGDEPAVLFWYELQIENGRPTWHPHQIDHDSGMGTQFEIADVNRDGLLDIVTANKKGVFYFEQRRE